MKKKDDFVMSWDKLLCEDKLDPEENEDPYWTNYPINAFEKDYNRIVCSAEFRRLQDKTQVFALDKNDFVRTRLTHSIEVSTIARQLGIMITNPKERYIKCNSKNVKDELIKHENAISSVLHCAGLIHDLGNPPFGHYGEVVIGEWFKKHLSEIEKDVIQEKNTSSTDNDTRKMDLDLQNFEGNAQSLRILLKSKYGSGINVSKAIISTLVKYPTMSTEFESNSEKIEKQKPGIFFDDYDRFKEISKSVGTYHEFDDLENGCIYRHPLAFVLEAADDIAYATSDLEDAFKKDFFTLDEFIAFFQDKLKDEKDNINKIENYSKYSKYSNLLIDKLKDLRSNNKQNKGKLQNDKDDLKAFSSWIYFVRRWLMYVVAYNFTSNYDGIMSGKYHNDLFADSFHCLSIKILKDAMKEYAYDRKSVLKLELSAENILSFLLDKFVNAFKNFDEDDKDKKDKISKTDKKYFKIFSHKYIEDYKQAKRQKQYEKMSEEKKEKLHLYLRLLMVTDYISGMTDSFARNLYRELNGNE